MIPYYYSFKWCFFFLKAERLQASSGLQDYSQYLDRYQQSRDMDALNSDFDLQFFMSHFQVLRDRSNDSYYNHFTSFRRFILFLLYIVVVVVP